MTRLLLILIFATTINADDRPIQFVSDKTDALYLSKWPATNDKAFNALKDRTVFYDEESMPAAYQDTDEALPGVHSPRYNISAVKQTEPFGNANREFPWAETAGMDNAHEGRTIRFIVFQQDDGAIRYWADKGDAAPIYRWQFADGTVFGELLLTRIDGKDYCFEARTRTRVSGEWIPNVFRPFGSIGEYYDAVNRTSWELTRKEVRLHDSNHIDRKVLDEKATLDVVSSLHPSEVKEALNRPFKSALLGDWCPTANEDNCIVPKGYAGGVIELGKASCMRCHETTGQKADVFHMNRGVGNPKSRDWYGRVRGSDGIFSFHPFALSSISDSGYSRPVRMRTELVKAGLLRHWNDPAPATQKREPARPPQFVFPVARPPQFTIEPAKGESGKKPIPFGQATTTAGTTVLSADGNSSRSRGTPGMASTTTNAPGTEPSGVTDCPT